MAYISAEEIKIIRDDLKKAFPYVKFSVRGMHHSTVIVTVLAAPFNFRFDNSYRSKPEDRYLDAHNITAHDEKFNTDRDGQATGFGHKYTPHGDHEAYVFLRQVKSIVTRKWWDKSDSQTDYFNTAFYFDIRVGDWQHPFVTTPRPEGLAILEDIPDAPSEPWAPGPDSLDFDPPNTPVSLFDAISSAVEQTPAGQAYNEWVTSDREIDEASANYPGHDIRAERIMANDYGVAGDPVEYSDDVAGAMADKISALLTRSGGAVIPLPADVVANQVVSDQAQRKLGDESVVYLYKAVLGLSPAQWRLAPAYDTAALRKLVAEGYALVTDETDSTYSKATGYSIGEYFKRLSKGQF